MVGQHSIVEKFNNYTLETLPHTVLIEGDFGSGKHTIVYETAKRLGIEVEDISNNLCSETFDRIYMGVFSKIYIINGDILHSSNGSILKFIEEPPITAYIFILCIDRFMLLPTIVNRCITFKLAPYTIDELTGFGCLDKDDYYKIADTPNKVLQWKSFDFESAISLGYLILEKVKTTKLSNVLTITDRIKFNEKDTGYDVDFFISVLKYCAYNNVINNRFPTSFNEYRLVSTLIHNLHVPIVDKKRVFENFLCSLKDCT